MTVEIEDDIIQSVQIEGGCSGNLQGICCGWKNTSCPDQLATALKQYRN